MKEDIVKHLKENFQLLDQDCDGFLSSDEVATLLYSLEIVPAKPLLEQALAGVPGQKLQFSDVLALATRFYETSQFDRSKLKPSLEVLKDRETSQISIAELRSLLTQVGERLTAEEVNAFLSTLPGLGDLSSGFVDYESFVKNFVQQ